MKYLQVVCKLAANMIRVQIQRQYQANFYYLLQERMESQSFLSLVKMEYYYQLQHLFQLNQQLGYLYYQALLCPGETSLRSKKRIIRRHLVVGRRASRLESNKLFQPFLFLFFNCYLNRLLQYNHNHWLYFQVDLLLSQLDFTDGIVEGSLSKEFDKDLYSLSTLGLEWGYNCLNFECFRYKSAYYFQWAGFVYYLETKQQIHLIDLRVDYYKID